LLMSVKATMKSACVAANTRIFSGSGLPVARLGLDASNRS
jgi:hypothetical protein